MCIMETEFVPCYVGTGIKNYMVKIQFKREKNNYFIF